MWNKSAWTWFPIRPESRPIRVPVRTITHGLWVSVSYISKLANNALQPITTTPLTLLPPLPLLHLGVQLGFHCGLPTPSGIAYFWSSDYLPRTVPFLLSWRSRRSCTRILRSHSHLFAAVHPEASSWPMFRNPACRVLIAERFSAKPKQLC